MLIRRLPVVIVVAWTLFFFEDYSARARTARLWEDFAGPRRKKAKQNTWRSHQTPGNSILD